MKQPLTYHTFGGCLKYYRTIADISLTKMAKDTNLSLSYLSLLESNKRRILKPDLLKTIAKCYQIPLGEILRVSGYIENQNNDCPDNNDSKSSAQKFPKHKDGTIAILS